MNRIAATVGTSQTLSMAGFAEAARHHRSVADLDDLLVALTLDDGLGGQALRSGGLDRESMRAAIAATRSQRLSALGVSADAVEPDDSSARRTARCTWSPRVLQLFQSVPASRDFSASILRAVLDEPSGHVADVLAHTGLDRTELERVLDAAADAPSSQRRAATDVLSGSASAHVAAPIDTVWALVCDPARLHEWAPAVGEPAREQEGGLWLTNAPATGPDGRPLRMREGVRLQQWQLIDAAEPTRVVWAVTYPALARANRQHLFLDLAPSAGGTRLQVTVEWHRTVSGGFPLLGRLLRPITRWATNQGARSTAHAIAGTFR